MSDEIPQDASQYDNTEGINSENKLRVLHRAVEQSSCSIVITDTDGNIEYVNPRFSQTTGYSADEAIGKNSHLLKSGEQTLEFYKELWQTIKSGNEWHGEFHNKRKDGTLFWEAASISPVFDDHNAISHFLAVKDDVTQRKQAEDALRASEQKFRGISESALDAVIMIDSVGTVMLWNKTAEKMLGYSADEVLGRYVHSVITPLRYRERAHKAFGHFATSGQGDIVGTIRELEALRKDGSEIPIELSISPIKLGDQWWAVGFVRDITERKRAEKELQENAAALKSANKELHEAYQTVEAATQAKSEFLANMSHEIRTPMNGIIGMSDLLADTPLNHEQHEYIDIVRHSADSLLTIINDILDFSKIEAGQLDLEQLDFDLRDTLESIADMFALKAQEKNLELTCTIEPDIPVFLRGDPGRLRQIVINLVSNAIKFTSKGEVAVRASLDRVNDNLATLRFTVTDTGIGVASDKKDLLFDAFTQADASTSRKYGGTGLGLAICKRLTTLMGGKIDFKSEPHHGSTFWFTAVFDKRAPVEEVVWENLEDIRDRRILVVDDNATNRCLMRLLLDSWGCRHDEAPEARSALEKLKAAVDAKDPFSVAIIDMAMPKINGGALGKMIKNDPTLAGTAMVMMTSVGHSGDVARMEDIGFVAYLTKPIKQSLLYNCLAFVLGYDVSGEVRAPRRIVTAETVTHGKGPPPRVLLAEDNVINQKVALVLLEKMGCKADAVANGKETLHALEMLPYDLVLMDVQMPEMDGYQATRLIRDPTSNVRNHKVPIIAMTAHAMKSDREKCLAAGMNDYISKPVHPTELVKILHKWISAIHPPKAENDQGQGEIIEDITVEQHPSAMPYPDNTNGILDSSALLNRYHDLDTIRELISLFLDASDDQLSEIRLAVDQGNATEIEQAAHKFKSAVATLCAPDAMLTAGQMESLGRSGNLEEADVIMTALENQILILKSALETEFPNPLKTTRKA